MITDQRGLKQELDLSVKDQRWDDAIRFRDTMRSQANKEKVEKEVADKICKGQTSGDDQDTSDEMQNGQATHGQDEMTITNLSHPYIKMEIGLQITHGPDLVISVDTIRAAQKMIETSVTPAVVKKERVEKEVADKICKGETSGDDQEASDEMPAISDDTIPSTIREAQKMMEAAVAPPPVKRGV